MKSRPHTPTSKKKTSRKLKVFSGVILLLAVLGAVAFIVYGFRHEHKEAGQFGISDTYIGENLSQSLDLKLASRASYPSSTLTTAKDLGFVDGLHEQIFSFGVMIDHLTEYGLMLTPPTAPPPKGYPTIILLHGFANPSRYSTEAAYLPDMQFYANHGFVVVKPDYRGQGESAGHGLPNSAYYSMDYNTDVMSLITALKQTSFIDKSNISIWGHSLGAYVGLRASVLSPDIKDVILLSGPIDSLKQMYLTYIPPSDELNPYALITRNEVFSKYGTPADESRFWDDASVTNYLSQIHAYIQIHVGLKDKTVPPKFSADLNSALVEDQIKHQYFVYADGNHSLGDQRDLIWTRSLQLLQAK
jgi:uncharacterized protein